MQTDTNEMVKAVRAWARKSNDANERRVAKWSRERILAVFEAHCPETEADAIAAVSSYVDPAGVM